VANDPQANNCPTDRGGKRGAPAVGGGDPLVHLFKTTSTPGFNADHVAGAVAAHAPFPASPARALTHPAYPVAQADGATKVKANTNADGEAGVIFMPSRCGGDRYRIRAYLGPPTIAGNGTGVTAVRVDTGTFVVWRNLRVSRYIRQQVNDPHPNLLAEVNNANFGITTNQIYLQRAWVVDQGGVNLGMGTIDFTETGRVLNDFDGIRRNYARAFVEVEIDRAAQANMPEDLSQADWQAAREQGLRDAVRGAPGMGLGNLDLRRLYHMEAGSPINVANAVVHIPMRTPTAYNAVAPVGQKMVDPFAAPLPADPPPAGNAVGAVVNLTRNFMIPGFLRALSQNGYRPGVTVITAAFGFSWAVYRLQQGAQSVDSSGVALEYGGYFVWCGQAAYPTTAPAGPPTVAGQTPWFHYSFTSNAAHEMGHCSYRLHGPGSTPGFGAPGGPDASTHDLQTGANQNISICVMSYQICEGQYCAKCLFAMRGWNQRALP
jgi:hypothetical protein